MGKVFRPRPVPLQFLFIMKIIGNDEDLHAFPIMNDLVPVGTKFTIFLPPSKVSWCLESQSTPNITSNSVIISNIRSANYSSSCTCVKHARTTRIHDLIWYNASLSQNGMLIYLVYMECKFFSKWIPDLSGIMSSFLTND